MRTPPDPVPASNVREPTIADVPKPSAPPLVWRCVACGHEITWSALSQPDADRAYKEIDGHNAKCTAAQKLRQQL